jgi:O-Antigen ligase
MGPASASSFASPAEPRVAQPESHFRARALDIDVVVDVLLIVAWILSVAISRSLTVDVSVAGIQVYFLDVVSLAAASIALVRIAKRGVRSLPQGLAIAFFVLVVFHVLRGMAEYEVQLAASSARPTFYFASALIFGSTIQIGRLARPLLATFICAGLALAVLAVPFWLADGLGNSSQFVVHDGQLVTARPIVATGALVILEAAILAAALRWPTSRAARWITGICAVAVVLLQHRTVWLAAGVVICVLAAHLLRTSRQSTASRTFAGIGLACFVLPILIVAFVSTGPLVQSVEEVTAQHSTFQWRTEGWEDLIRSHDSPGDIIAGTGAGSSYERLVNGERVDASAHDGYIEVMLRTGVIGLVVLCGIFFTVWRRRRVIAERLALPTIAVVLLLAAQLIFNVAYWLDGPQGLLLGFFVAAATSSTSAVSHRRRQPNSGPAPPVFGQEAAASGF